MGAACCPSQNFGSWLINPLNQLFPGDRASYRARPSLRSTCISCLLGCGSCAHCACRCLERFQGIVPFVQGALQTVVFRVLSWMLLGISRHCAESCERCADVASQVILASRDLDVEADPAFQLYCQWGSGHHSFLAPWLCRSLKVGMFLWKACKPLAPKCLHFLQGH